MKGFFAEFKEFISRGNVVDLAVGVIIGGAFTAIVTALVDSVIMPLISVLFGGISFEQWNIPLGTGAEAPVLGIGTLVAAIINFFLIALLIFLVIKGINKAASLVKKEEKEAAPETKECPFCRTQIPIAAIRCPHCTSVLEKSDSI
ncbi:MAG: large conductance mechanosensitive channel protein MscL [Eubacterium sp.]|nr:large conductance mechanosensitive channel protein MscL [Eubacterium sp.]